jgi:hypothetical protein
MGKYLSRIILIILLPYASLLSEECKPVSKRTGRAASLEELTDPFGSCKPGEECVGEAVSVTRCSCREEEEGCLPDCREVKVGCKDFSERYDLNCPAVTEVSGEKGCTYDPSLPKGSRCRAIEGSTQKLNCHLEAQEAKAGVKVISGCVPALVIETGKVVCGGSVIVERYEPDSKNPSRCKLVKKETEDSSYRCG